MNIATPVRVGISGSNVVSKKIKQGLLTVDLIIPAFNEVACPPKTSPGKMLESGLSGKGAF